MPPRMAAEGTLTIDGKAVPVTGDVWFDHQWGDFEAAQLRWNWFALQLTDGAASSSSNRPIARVRRCCEWGRMPRAGSRQRSARRIS